MMGGVADTHTAIWYATADSLLSPAAKSFIDAAQAERQQIGLSSITLVEMVYLQEKGRIRPTTLTAVLALLDEIVPVLAERPVNRSISATVARINRAQIPDMPDRIIAASALSLNVPVSSRDRRIASSGIPTIW